jgi:hypothetical protein
MFLAYVVTWPCFVGWFNYVELVGLAIMFAFYSGALCIALSGNAWVGIIVCAAQSVIAIGTCYWTLRKLFADPASNVVV